MLIYDNQGETLDRYTVIPWPDDDDPDTRRMFLGCAKGGVGYSEWGELVGPPKQLFGCPSALRKPGRGHPVAYLGQS